MKKFFTAVIGLLIIAQIQIAAAAQLQFGYQAFVQNYGWMETVGNGKVAGTTGKGLRMEALKINLTGGTIEYCVHVQNYGWQPWKSSGEIAGTSGKSLRLEAIRVKLTGDTANHFDIYYRTHVQNGGWLGWAKNGEPAGTTGAGLRMEALQIQIVPKGTAVNRGGQAFYQPKPSENSKKNNDTTEPNIPMI